MEHTTNDRGKCACKSYVRYVHRDAGAVRLGSFRICSRGGRASCCGILCSGEPHSCSGFSRGCIPPERAGGSACKRVGRRPTSNRGAARGSRAAPNNFILPKGSFLFGKECIFSVGYTQFFVLFAF